MAFSPLAVANEMIDLAQKAGVNDMTPMKVQKLVFYAHSWHLALCEDPLIDEQVEAWEYGPVIPSLYRELREYRDSPIKNPIVRTEFSIEGTSWTVTTNVPRVEQEGKTTEAKKAKEIIEGVWEQYGQFSGISLSNMTHYPGTPWHTTVETAKRDNAGILPRGTDIPSSVIKNYFKSVMKAKA